MWKAVNDYLNIVDDLNNFICIVCVYNFTVFTLLFGLTATALLLALICTCNEKMITTGKVATFFCTLLVLYGIIIIVTELVWFDSYYNIVYEQFENSSDKHFRKQTLKPEVRLTWDEYETNLGCCGVHDYKDYYLIFGNNSVPLSCCNQTTTQSIAECEKIVKNVSENDVLSYRIHGEGCPAVVNEVLNWNSTSVYRIGIAATFGSVYIFSSILLTIILAVIIIPKDGKERCLLLQAVCKAVDKFNNKSCDICPDDI